MSCTFHAYMHFGFPVTETDLVDVTPRRGCDHLETSATFCGECGKPTWDKSYTRKNLHELSSSDINARNCGVLQAEMIGHYVGFIGILFAALVPGETCQLAPSPTPIEQSQLVRKIEEWCVAHSIKFEASKVAMRLVHTWS